MGTKVIESLEMNADIVAFVKDRLESWGESHEKDYDEAFYDVKELSVQLVLVMYDYLREHGSGELLAKTAKRTGVSRKSVHRYTKK